jgi:hypothetical protein
MMDDEHSIFAPTIGDQQEFEDDIYKKWFRTKDRSGFLSLRGWLEAGKVSVDIGETSGQGLQNNTMVWTNAVELVVYLKAIYDGNGASLFPAPRGSEGSPETFTYYGGATVDGKPISRILKIEHWSTIKDGKKLYDSSGFAWKCGHFGARKADSGAFIPDMTQSLSQNKIKVSRREMAEIFYRLDMVIQGFVAREEDSLRSLNGNKK